MNVFVIDGAPAYVRMWERNGHTVVDEINEHTDVVQFTGGEDVTPEMYGEERHPKTHNNSVRDGYEHDIFHVCRENGIAMVGICRGSQFLNVMNGGSLWQHVNNHAISGTHVAVDVRSGKMVNVSSTHHQMMDPGPLGDVLAVASESTWKECMDGGEVSRIESERGQDIEAVWYPGTDSLCFQPHPEFFDPDHPCQRYFFDLVREFIGE